jgi:hypothetical protein
MKNLVYVLFALVVLSSSTCKKEEPIVEDIGDATLVIKGKIGNQTLVFNKPYTYTDGTPFKVSKFQLYLSDVALLADPDNPSSTQDKEIPLSDVFLMDLESSHSDSLSAVQGARYTFENIPSGTYKGLKLGLGVYQELNRKTPSFFSSTHPLSLSSNYWETWSSYIFAKIEGKTDPNMDGTFPQGFLYHTGTDNLYRQIELRDKSITVVKDVNNDIVLTVDLMKVLSDGTNSVDIVGTPISHTSPDQPAQVQISTIIMDNFAKAIQYE